MSIVFGGAPIFFLSQPPNQVNGIFADASCSLCGTGQQTVADNFASICNFYNRNFEIVIWGGYYPEDIPNATDDFTIITHTDAGGAPGSVIDTRSGLQATSRELTGVVLYGTHEYKFTFDFYSNPIMLLNGPATYWIEIFNNSVESGNFFWETGNLDPFYGTAGSGWYTTTPATSWNLDPATDMSILIENDNWVPVELLNFQAAANGTDVNLNWVTATETNNRGFSIQRNSGGEFKNIGFVEGNGTTTGNHAYSYTDRNLSIGSYSYRLMQIDYDGTDHYSNVVEVDVNNPSVFSLEQNYPNPFNPSTKISYSLAVNSKVKLTVYNVLGETVATLVNATDPAGNHEVTFNGINLNSGIYFYRLEAADVDGRKFSQVKKMMLTK